MKIEIKKSDAEGVSQPYWFRIRAANGNILASSEMYANKADAVSAAESIQAGIALVPIEDLT